MTSHEPQLAYQVLLYAISALRNGNLSAIKNLDLTAEEIEQISHLNVKSLHYFASLSEHFLSIQTDHDTFQRMLDHVSREMEQDKLIDTLIQHEAPINMMIDLFGLSSSEYVKRQTLLGITSPGAGRPPALSEKTQLRVWDEWKKHDALAEPERFLTIAQTLNLPIRSIWSQIHAWEKSVNEGLNGNG